ncbi:hypothetical protein B7G54_35505 [Burkholderia puraquae]|nr:hypothetical protein B7G54_35505 [Burkholderia puraquae]
MKAVRAGAAIHHAERNEENESARPFQIWLHPRTPGGTPRWTTRICLREGREGRFVTLASGDPDDVCASALSIRADARARIGTLRQGTTVHHVLPGSGVRFARQLNQAGNLHFRSRLIPVQGQSHYDRLID